MARKKFRIKSAMRTIKAKYVSGTKEKEEGVKEPLIPALPSAAMAPQKGPIEVRVVGKPAVEIAGAEVEGGVPGVGVAAEAEKEQLAEEEAIRGISLEELGPRRGVISEERLEEIRGIARKYPLTPNRPKEGEPVYAWAEIFFEEAIGELVYHVREPELSRADARELSRIKSLIEEKIDIHFESLTEAQAIDYLKRQIDEIIKLFSMTITPDKRAAYEYYIFRDFIGLGKIQPLMNDDQIEDVSCDGVGVPLFIYHRDPAIGSIRTTVAFESADELDSFVMKLAQRTKKAISVAEPLLQGALPDGSRVQATLGTDIARRGSNFTIRKFVTEPLTPVHMINFGTLDAKILAYLWFAIEHNASVLVAGPTAAGKTSLLNALALFIKPALKVVSIEDTAELRLPLPNWIPHVARPGFGVTTTGLKIGEISMFDLLKASLRQRPDYIIVGEVRGEEAYVLFQEMATGHAGMSTLHADSLDRIIDRLTTPPINLPASLLETLNIILFVKFLRYRDRNVRRISEVIEVVRYDLKERILKTKRTFKWDSSTDKFLPGKDSVLLAKIAQQFGMKEEQVKAELANRIKVLEWMRDRGITYYRDVGRVISLYYSNPARLMAMVEA